VKEMELSEVENKVTEEGVSTVNWLPATVKVNEAAELGAKGETELTVGVKLLEKLKEQEPLTQAWLLKSP